LPASILRSIAFVLATFAASAPAAAEGWEEHNYPEYAFSVTFPANMCAPSLQHAQETEVMCVTTRAEAKDGDLQPWAAEVVRTRAESAHEGKPVRSAKETCWPMGVSVVPVI
jgi:hypothetical protein